MPVHAGACQAHAGPPRHANHNPSSINFSMFACRHVIGMRLACGVTKFRPFCPSPGMHRHAPACVVRIIVVVVPPIADVSMHFGSSPADTLLTSST